MGRHSMAGKVQTVLGTIEPRELGITLSHEHLLVDLTRFPGDPEESIAPELYDQPLSLENLGYVSYYHVPNLDNARLDDVDTAIDEARLYVERGGKSMIDATCVGIGRDPEALAHISRETGLNVIMGASYYVEKAHPDDMDQRSEDDIVAEIVRDVTEGVDDTGIKSGIIGEVGCSWPLADNERKVLRASGRAQRITGAPLLIHPGRDETAPMEIVDILREVGADIGHTIISHVERTVFQKDILRRLAETGCYLSWDQFGREISYYWPNTKIDMPSDGTKIADVAWAVSEGFADQVMVAHDICYKTRLIKYGGHGYFYLLGHIVPRMLAKGVPQEAIDKMLVDNPAAALVFTEPKAPLTSEV